MNTDNYNRFDELIREKLDSYETEPDMDLLVNIHARKNRFLKSRNLLTIITLLAILMAGIVGGYYLNNSRKNNSQNKQQNSELSSVNSTTHASNKKAFIHMLLNNDALSSTSFTNSGSEFFHVKNTNHTDKNTTAKQLTHNNKTASSVNTSGNVQNNTLNDVTITASTSVNATDTDEKEAKNNQPEKENADNCTASFNYYTNYDHSLHFMATTSSTADVVLNWQFGDGAGSSEINPKHTYNKPGQYAVILTALNTKTNCRSEIYKLIEVTKTATPTSSTIKGTVFSDAEYAAKTMVQLLEVSNKSGYRTAQTTFTNTNGYYEFNEITAGNYLVKVADYKHYQSTFYGNTIENEEATNVVIFKDDYEILSGYDIHMVSEKNPYENTRIKSDTGYRLMIVFDENNQPIATVSVNADGTVKDSGKLPPGNYNMMDAASGKPGGMLNVSDDGTADTRQGILKDEPRSEVTLAPNPASNSVNIALTNADNSPVEITIINYAGSIVKQFTLPNGSSINSVDINSLSGGTYYVIVRQNGNTATSTLIKASDNSR